MHGQEIVVEINGAVLGTKWDTKLDHRELLVPLEELDDGGDLLSRSPRSHAPRHKYVERCLQCAASLYATALQASSTGRGLLLLTGIV